MIGGIVIKFAFAAIFISALSFYLAHRGKTRLIPSARIFFFLGVGAVAGAAALLLNNILTHQFQYTYVWSYSSTDLPLPLLISTFYAGQEGSFMLWALFTAVIGIFLQRYSQKHGYEAATMSVYSVILLFLLTMLIVKDPFEYIWNTFRAELVHSGPIPPNVVKYVVLDAAAGIWAHVPVEGKGLNPLLQNYWMVIHPQVLFIGFASMAVPYTMAMAAMMKRDYQSWIRVATPWAVFGAMVLGLGIMMGGYWAYETLGWGGYWAWDPVENSSLVPWLFCVASIHTSLVQRKNGNYVKSNIVLSLLTFIAVLYSTFLTRSGILGDTSVHSFVDPGMWAYVMLLVFLAFFIVLGFGLFALRFKEIPKPKVEHAILSKEFALFLGASALTFVAVFTIVGTSSPLITSITEGKPSAVEMDFYVKTNLPLAILIAILSGLGQLLWWKNSKKEPLTKSLLAPVLVGAAITAGLFLEGSMNLPVAIFAFASSFSLVANMQVGYSIFSGNPRVMGGALTHIGLAIMFVGFVTTNVFDDHAQVALEQGKPANVLGYSMTYHGAHPLPGDKYGFHVELEKNGRTHSMTPIMYFSTFTNGVMRNPDVLNLMNRDIYIAPLGLEEAKLAEETTVTLKQKESTLYEGLGVTFVGFDMSGVTEEDVRSGHFAFRALFEVADGAYKHTVPLAAISSEGGMQFPAVPYIAESGREYVLRLANITPPMVGTPSVDVTVGVRTSPGKDPRGETLVIEASIKPMINFVWAGTITLLLGLALTLYRRLGDARKRATSDDETE